MFFSKPAAPGDARKLNQSYQTPRLLFLFLLISEVIQLPKRTSCVGGCPRLRLVSHAFSWNFHWPDRRNFEQIRFTNESGETLVRCGAELTWPSYLNGCCQRQDWRFRKTPNERYLVARVFLHETLLLALESTRGKWGSSSMLRGLTLKSLERKCNKPETALVTFPTRSNVSTHL